MLQDEIEPFVRWSGLIGQSLLDAHAPLPRLGRHAGGCGNRKHRRARRARPDPRSSKRAQNMLTTLIMEEAERRVADESAVSTRSHDGEAPATN